MSVKKGLGKGLGALITETNVAKIESDAKDGILEIDINKIEPNRQQPRKHFEEESLRELADSIREYGVIQPLLVKKEAEDYYSIVAGERRWRAARLAKLTHIPVIIKDCNESQTLQIALIENLQREDLNPIEEALSYRRLMDEFFFKQDDIGEKIGKSRSSISYILSLLQLDHRVQNLLAGGLMSASLAKTLLQLKDGDEQFYFAEKIIEEELSVKQANAMIKTYLEEDIAKDAEKTAKAPSTNYSYLETDLKQILGTKVNIRDGKNKGKIEIEFYSPQELDRLLGIFKSMIPNTCLKGD